MDKKLVRYSAITVSGVFSPLIVPVIGFLLLMNQIPGVEFYSVKLKIIFLAAIVLSSCLIPFLYFLLSNLNRKILHEKGGRNSNVLFYLFTCLSYFLGAQFLGRLPVSGVFRAMLIGGCFILLVISLISFKWKIAEHTIALGGLWGTLIALNFRYGMDVIWLLILVSLIAGIVGTSRVYLERNSPTEVYAGFAVGVAGMLCFLLFI
jgi:hypothetical protein